MLAVVANPRAVLKSRTMYVLVDLGADSVSLVEPDEFARFNVEVRGGFDADAVDLLLGNRGWVASVEHAFIETEALRALAGPDVDEAWTSSLQAMVDYAARQGWMDEAGTAIRAHMEWPPDSSA